MSTYKPRRDSSRWLDGDCPAGVLAIFDHPNFGDRYTIIYRATFEHAGRIYLQYVSASERPFHPQGIGMHGEFQTWQARDYRYANRHRKCKWSALPDDVKRLVRQDLATDEKEAA